MFCGAHHESTRHGVTYTVQLQGITIGHTELEHPDATKGVARGSFNPATGYQLVQDVFGLYAEAVPERPGKVADPVERLETMACFYLDYGLENTDLWRLVFSSPNSKGAAGFDSWFPVS